MTILSQLQKLVANIHNSRFAMTLDGSVHAPNGSFSWVINGTYSKAFLKGYNTLTGGNSDLSTFRTEAYGYLGTIYALETVFTCFPPCTNATYITSELHIDNVGVVKRSHDTPFSIQQCLQPDWDIMHEAYTVRLSFLATISVLHVKSHQDETTSNPNTLPLPAQINIMADLGTHQA